MGSRVSTFKKGGGFLNNVDGVIVGYQWTDEFNGKPFKAGKKNGKDLFHTLYLALSARVDGADEDSVTHLFAGGYDDFEVSEDGLTLTAADGGPCALGDSTGAAKFYKSLVAAGFPDTNFSEDEDIVNFEPANGTRVRFIQRVDEESTKKLGKRKDPKTGKEYSRTDLVVDQVYELASAKKSAPAAKGAKGKKTPVEVDVDALSKQTIIDLATEAGGSISTSKLSVKVLMALKGQTKETIDQVRKNVTDVDYLAQEEGWSYDAKTKLVTVEVE